MAWAINALNAPITATTTLYTLSSNEFGGSEVRIVGTGFTYDAVSGLLNGGTITSMSLVANGGTETVQTVTMTGGLPAATYFAFTNAAHLLQAQMGAWSLQFPNDNSGFTFSTTQISIAMLDGTKVVISGSGFDQNADLGTVTSIEHLAADNSVLQSATGMPQPLGVVATAFGNSDDVYGILTQGDNVVAQVGNNFLMGLDGGAGNDTIIGNGNFLEYGKAAAAVNVNISTLSATGAAGTDSLVGTFFGIDGSGFNDTLTGDNNHNQLLGENGNDTLNGLGGDDTLDGGKGDDILNGGAGSDTADYSFLGTQEGVFSGVTVDLSIAGPQDTVGQGVDTLISIENVIGSVFDDTLTGDANNNMLDGGNGNDVLNGGAGADQMYGDNGDDTYYIDNPGDFANEFDAFGGIDTVFSTEANSAIGSNIENFNYTGNVFFSLFGNASNNTINAGNASGSFIEGGAGDDVINGSNGTDTLLGDSNGGNALASSGISFGAGAVVHSGAANGSLATALNVSNQFSLADNPNIAGATIVPHVTVQATGGGVIDYYSVQINNAGASIIADIDHGFGTANNFQGAPVFTAVKFYDPNGNEMGFGTGSDPNSGAGGSTTYTDSYNSTSAYITGLWKIAVFTYTGNYPSGVISPVANGATYDLNISVTGELQSFNDTLHGNGGDDFLIGGLGNDILDGGTGTDTADYSAALLSVTASLGGQFASGADVGSDTLISIENINGGAGNDTISGDGQANVIVGNGGDDLIFAGDGADNVSGGDGNDTLVGNTNLFANDHDTLDGGVGNDIIHGEAADTVIGGAGQDFLYSVNDFAWNIDLGTAGIEWMFAGFGNDVINAATQTASVEIYGGGGSDTITGSAQDDFLWAGGGNDIVVGGDGADLLFGDLGADSLSGGAGNDRIYVDSTDTFIDGGAGFDAIYITSGAGMTFDMAAQGIEWVADFAGGNDILNGAAMTADMTTYAGGGNDIITGGAGNDFLWGEAGDDAITGGSGGDVLVGGIGADVLTGGAGIDVIYLNSGGGSDGVQDTVVFTAGWGTDFVFDFVHGEDKLDLSALGIVFQDLTITTQGLHAYVQIGAGPDLIAVAGNGGLLLETDFIF